MCWLFRAGHTDPGRTGSRIWKTGGGRGGGEAARLQRHTGGFQPPRCGGALWGSALRRKPQRPGSASSFSTPETASCLSGLRLSALELPLSEEPFDKFRVNESEANGLSFSGHIRDYRTKKKKKKRRKRRRGLCGTGKGSQHQTVHKSTALEHSIDLLTSIPHAKGFWGPTL